MMAFWFNREQKAERRSRRNRVKHPCALCEQMDFSGVQAQLESKAYSKDDAHNLAGPLVRDTTVCALQFGP